MTIKSVEKQENFEVHIVAVVDAKTFNSAVDKIYRKNRGSIQIPGFRKGKVPRKIIEQFYGATIFTDDAADQCIKEVFPEVLKESGVMPECPAGVEGTNIAENGDLEITYVCTVMPEQELTGYLDLQIEKKEIPVTEQDVDQEMKNYQLRASRLVESTEPCKDQDVVEIDFQGTIDGVPFEGGSASNYALKLGSNTFIPGFEDQLLGHSAGDAVDVTVTFPEDYQEASLAGKEAVFHTLIQTVKYTDMPPMDDELAKDVSEFDTLEELRADTEVQLKKQAAVNANNQYGIAILQALKDMVTVEIPAQILDYNVSQERESTEKRLNSYNLTLDVYARQQGVTPATFEAEWRKEFEEQYKEFIVLDAIAKGENLEADEQDIEADNRDFSIRESKRRKALKLLEKHYGFSANMGEEEAGAEAAEAMEEASDEEPTVALDEEPVEASDGEPVEAPDEQPAAEEE